MMSPALAQEVQDAALPEPGEIAPVAPGSVEPLTVEPLRVVELDAPLDSGLAGETEVAEGSRLLSPVVEPVPPPVPAPLPEEEIELAVTRSEVSASPAPDFEAPLVEASSGFNFDGLRFGSLDQLFGGAGLGGGWDAEAARAWNFGASLSGIYDSNVRNRRGQDDDDFITRMGLNARYRSLGREWKVFLDGGVDYSIYASQSNLGGLGYGLSAGGSYLGPKLNATLRFSSNLQEGGNRYYGNQQVEIWNFGTDLSLSYDLGPKTYLSGGFKYSWTDPDHQDYGSTESLSASVSAMWRYSELLRVGPGIRYSHQDGDLQSDRQSVAPTLSLNYTLTSKVALNGTAGWNFSEYGGPNGGSSDSLYLSLGMNYRISDLWGASFTVHRDGGADGARSAAYRETLAVRANFTRQMPKGRLAFGLGYENSDQESTTGRSLRDGDLEYYTLNASYHQPVFAGKANAGIFGSWRETDGNRSVSEDGYQVGFSLSMGF